jgi:anti-sigma regulatory factor (Ser/Thr protein kinase)
MKPPVFPAVTKDLLASGASAGLARDAVTRFLRSVGLERHAEAGRSIITELLVNAVTVSRPAAVVRMHVGRRDPHLCFGVQDGAPLRLPRPRVSASTLAEIDTSPSFEFGGWGLVIVRALADRMWVQQAGPGAKWVCASIDFYRR